jgi:hypothetical protein
MRLAHPQSRPQYQVSPFVTMPRNYALQEIGSELRSIAATCASYRLRNVGTVLEPGLRGDLQICQLAAFSQDRCDPRALTVGRKKRISSILTKGGIADAWTGEHHGRTIACFARETVEGVHR